MEKILASHWFYWLMYLVAIKGATGCTTVNVNVYLGQEDGGTSNGPDMIDNGPDLINTGPDSGNTCEHVLKVTLNVWANRAAVPGSTNVRLLAGVISTAPCLNSTMVYEIDKIGFSVWRDFGNDSPSALDYCASIPCSATDAFFVNAKVVNLSNDYLLMGSVAMTQTWQDHVSVLFTDSFRMEAGQTIAFELLVDISDQAASAIGMHYFATFDGASIKNQPNDFCLEVNNPGPGMNRLLIAF